MALGLFDPVLDQFPNFTALKLTAAGAGFVGGDEGVFELTLDGITVELNLGGPLVQLPLAGNATIDFVESFPVPPNAVVGYRVDTGTNSDPIYLDFQGEHIVASVEWAELHISEFVHIAGSFAFTKGDTAEVHVTGGLLGALGDKAGDFLSDLGLDEDLMDNFPVLSEGTTNVSFLTIGASNVHAFIGMNGPYWTDTNGDKQIQGGEINEDAIGLVITDLDFGMAIMRPTSLGDFAKYFALKASASGISLVGVEGATVTADNLLVEINQSSPSVYGNPLFPVVDFETSYPSEQQALFDALVELLDANSNQTLDTGELNGVLEGGYTGDSISTADELVLLLHAGGAPPDILTVDEVLEQLDATFVAAHELDIRAADADQDGKFDPAGYEVNTGGTPVYLRHERPPDPCRGVPADQSLRHRSS